MNNTLKFSKIKEIDIDDVILIGNVTKNRMLKKMISSIFSKNKKIINYLLNEENNFDEKMEYYAVTGAILQSLNLTLLFPKYKLKNISNLSFGIENFEGQMEFGIKKGTEIPSEKSIYVKFKKFDENSLVKIKIYEGEDKYAKNNKLISCENVEIKGLENKLSNDCYEILFQFEIDINNNLNIFILEPNTWQKKYKFLTEKI